MIRTKQMRYIRIASLVVGLGISFFFSARAEPPTVSVPQTVLPLPGKLDDTEVFNSNSPEVVKTSGILVSTFPHGSSNHSGVNLNYPLNGRFFIFFHHIHNGIKTDDHRTLYLGCLIRNASNQKVKLRVVHAASYLSQPDAPFIDLPPMANNQDGKLYAGPGDRVMLDYLRTQTPKHWRRNFTLAPEETNMLFCLPIPVRQIGDPLNGRSGMVEVQTTGPVYVATLALFGKDEHGKDRSAPNRLAFEEVLAKGELAGPRDVAPTPPEQKDHIKYGRVAGVDRGSVWQSKVTNDGSELDVKPGDKLSWPISTAPGGTLGTDQVQSAPMVVRYPDTAYAAHGNYGVLYDIDLPVKNSSNDTESIELRLETPVKAKSDSHELTFYDNPPKSVFFRGSVAIQYPDDKGKPHDKYIHLVEKQGEIMDPLLKFELSPGESRKINVSFLYPPDATPPQVLTVNASTFSPDISQAPSNRFRHE